MTKTLSLSETDLCMICSNVHQDVADFSSSKAAQKLQRHHYLIMNMIAVINLRVWKKNFKRQF